MNFTELSLLLVCLLWAFILVLNANLRRRRQSSNLPPGPYPLPIIGNFHQLGRNPHHSLTSLAKTYGPLMLLRLGCVDTIIVSSPEIAKEILQKHDHSFPGRRISAAARVHDHHTASVACLTVGHKWRSLRKIYKEQMFSTQRMDCSRRLRQEKLQKLVDFCRECGLKGRAMDIGEAAFVTSLNLISNTLFSVDFADYGTDTCEEFKGIIRGFMRVLGRFNLGDYVGILRGFDLQGIQGEAKLYMGKLLGIFDGIIDERVEMLKNKCDDEKKEDLLEALMQMNHGIGSDDDNSQLQFSPHEIKHLLLDLFIAGTDTSSGTVEWAMTELLRNPKVMSKAKMELQQVVGQGKQVEESDIPKLHYLQAVIKESFRYHPPGTFLMRQKGEEGHLEIRNRMIPNNATVLINMWAIGRDPSVWSNPDSFDPERFLSGEAAAVDVKGQHFELTPFGAGRRICPGLPLAYRMVHLMVASLIHNFDWELEHGMDPKQVDIREKFGVTLQKAVPLKAVPFYVNK